jgi:hypothetical protein
MSKAFIEKDQCIGAQRQGSIPVDRQDCCIVWRREVGSGGIFKWVSVVLVQVLVFHCAARTEEMRLEIGRKNASESESVLM